MESIRAFALPRWSPARRLPEEVLVFLCSFVGSLPTIDEAVSLTRDDLRGILGRRLRRHIAAKTTLSALSKTLLRLTHPSLSEAERRRLYCDALVRRDAAKRDDDLVRASLKAVRAKLASTNGGDAFRGAMLRHELLRLGSSRAGPA